MPVGSRSSPHHDFEDKAGFRECTLFLFPPEDAAALRHVGRLLHTLTLEASPYFGEPRESQTRRELEAALADALYLRDFFWSVSREVEESELGAEDARLSRLARELMAEMDRLIDSLQEGLA